MDYVVVSTNPAIKHVGSVYGPFEDRKDAQKFIDDSNFPQPEDCLIRRIYPPRLSQ